MAKKKKTKKEFSKTITKWLLIVAVVDVQLTYVLAFIGRDNVETLAITLVTEIIAVMASYCTKAYFGKKAEEKTRLDELQQEYEHLNGLIPLEKEDPE